MVKKGLMSNVLDEEMAGLDTPIESGLFDYFKGGKLLCKLIYEDGSYNDFYIKFNTSYIVTINKREYLVVPKCIVRGKNNMITWYFNNPMPINFEYQQSKVTALSILEQDKKKTLSDKQKTILAKTTIDAEGLFSIFNTRLIKGLYPVDSITGKTMLIYMGVALIVILLILQLTGTVDVVGELSKIFGGK